MSGIGTGRRDDKVVVENRRELFVDGLLVERLDNARLVVHHPQPREIALTCDAPWEGTGPGYTTVFQDGDLYRMYYRAQPPGGSEDAYEGQLTCYAESDDGIRWCKPELGIFEARGSKRNNAVWRGSLSHNIVPFRDDNPAVLADQRYKAVGGTRFGPEGGLWALASQDGIHWRKLSEGPLPLPGDFDSQNVTFWDANARLYRAYWRGDNPTIPGRDVRAATSPDFVNWTEHFNLDYRPGRSGSAERDQGDDPSGDHHQLYTNGILPYFRAPHLLLGFPMRYTDRGWTVSTDHLPDADWRREAADKNIGGGRPTRLGTVVTDTLLMAGRDGKAFLVWPEAFVRPGIQRSGSWYYGGAAVAWGLVETASSLEGAPTELSMYVSEKAGPTGPGRLRRYTLRMDGFVSVHADLAGGTLLTPPLGFSGSHLEINFATSAGGTLRVEIQQADGTPIPGFTINDCPLQYGDALDRIVT